VPQAHQAADRVVREDAAGDRERTALLQEAIDLRPLPAGIVLERDDGGSRRAELPGAARQQVAGVVRRFDADAGVVLHRRPVAGVVVGKAQHDGGHTRRPGVVRRQRPVQGVS
jgi:hypothetical protein